MMKKILTHVGFGAILLVALLTNAQASEEPAASVTESPNGAKDAWEISGNAYFYWPSEDNFFVLPTVTADRGIHLEARYNYEAMRTGSLWAGWNFGVGENVRFDVTPMLGGVFGETNGLAPGYRFSLAWNWLELSSEGEYLFDLEEFDSSYFYVWSELAASPLDWLWFGYAVQRTRAYQTNLDFQRGFVVGGSYRFLSASFYVFNLGWEDPTFIFSLTAKG
jgi:hypothetical protein